MRKCSSIKRQKGVIRLLAIGLLAIAAVIVCGKISRSNHAKILTNEDRLEYLSQLGWTAEETPIAEQIIQLPTEFPPVLEQYNALQLQQGFDLKLYGGKEAEMYIYRILNHPSPPEQGDVYACLYIHKGRVIGGDIHSASMTGFMEGLRK